MAQAAIAEVKEVKTLKRDDEQTLERGSKGRIIIKTEENGRKQTPAENCLLSNAACVS